MERLADISSFESLGMSRGGSSVFNAINLAKAPAGGSINLTEGSGNATVL